MEIVLPFNRTFVTQIIGINNHIFVFEKKRVEKKIQIFFVHAPIRFHVIKDENPLSPDTFTHIEEKKKRVENTIKRVVKLWRNIFVYQLL